MARYFFDFVDGDRDEDHEGIELAAEVDAVREAIRYAGALLEDEPTLLQARSKLQVTARAADRRVVARIEVALNRPD